MNGQVAEYAWSRLLKSASISTVQFDSLTLINIAKQSELGKRRIKFALSYILKEYGHSVRQLDGTFKTKVSWSNVPASVILDYIYGIDSVFSYRGWVLAVDVTVNEDSIRDKQGKLEGLRPMWSAIGIDKVAIAHLVMPDDRPALAEVGTATAVVKAVMKGEQIVKVAL